MQADLDHHMRRYQRCRTILYSEFSRPCHLRSRGIHRDPKSRVSSMVVYGFVSLHSGRGPVATLDVRSSAYRPVNGPSIRPVVGTSTRRMSTVAPWGYPIRTVPRFASAEPLPFGRARPIVPTRVEGSKLWHRRRRPFQSWKCPYCWIQHHAAEGFRVHPT